MQKIIKTLPMPVSGLMLGSASLGNLMGSYSPVFKTALGSISMILFILITIKFITYPKKLWEDLKNPVLSALAPTYPMGIMLLSVYAKPYIGNASKVIWMLAIIIYVYTFLHFVIRFTRTFRINNIYLPYMIPFIGASVITMTSSTYDMHTIGVIAFYFSAVSAFILVWPEFYRYLKYPDIPEAVKPSFTILSAPIAIILVAYFSVAEDKNTIFIVILLTISIVSYIIVLMNLPGLIKLKFYHSCAAFTFPMVIAASSSKLSYYYFLGLGQDIFLLKYFYHFETLVVLYLVALVLVRYIKNSVNEIKKAA